MKKNETTPASAYGLLVFLTFLNLLNMLDRQLVAVLGKPITDDLGMTDTQFGLLVGMAFVMFYTVVGVYLGTVADRWHRPRLMAAGLLVWSALTAASGMAQKFWHIFTARLFVGVGEATLTPAATSILSDVFKPGDRAMAMGVYYTGITLGAASSFLIAGEIVGTRGYDWRVPFYVLGIFGVVLSFFVLWGIKDPRHSVDAHAAQVPARRSTYQVVAEVFKLLFSSPALLLVFAGAVILIFSQGAWWFIPKWITSGDRGLTQQEIGRIGAPILASGGLVGAFLGGVVSDRCHRRWSGGRLYFLAVAQLVITPFLVAFTMLSRNDVLFYVCWFMASISLTLPFGPIFASVQDLVPARIRSTMIALLLFCINFLGTAPGSFFTGFISDRTNLTSALIVVFSTAFLSVPLLIAAGVCYSRERARAREVS